MKQLIVVLSGKKQSGKSTTCNYFAAKYLNILYCSVEFGINRLGELTLRGEKTDIQIYGPNTVKLYSFADPLKEFCVNVIGAKHGQCYGTDAEKNSPIPHLLWDNVPEETRTVVCREDIMTIPELAHLRPQGPVKWAVKAPNGWLGYRLGAITGRELMQWFGTDIMRRLYHDIWAQGTYTKIKNDGKQLALITDGRFPNEITLGQENQNADVVIKTMRLLRSVNEEDKHPSETALDDFPLDKYSAVLDNRTMTIEEQCEALDLYIEEWFAEAGIPNERCTSVKVPSQETV